jgi:formamidopyrimidine-DNA glycosylase
LLADVLEKIATFLMEQVITAGGKFHADETVWAQIVGPEKQTFSRDQWLVVVTVVV